MIIFDDSRINKPIPYILECARILLNVLTYALKIRESPIALRFYAFSNIADTSEHDFYCFVLVTR